jgi:hypothetical protein
VRRHLANTGLGLLARILWAFSRPERVQLDAYRAVCLLYPLASRFYAAGLASGQRKDWHASMMNRLLSVFTRIDPGFTLHVDILNGAMLTDTHERHGGVLVCTGHFGLTLAAHAALPRIGVDPVFVGSLEGGVRDMQGWNWGTARPLDAIDTDRLDVLRVAAARLRSGAVIVSYVDYDPAELEGRRGGLSTAISPNAFVWASLNDAPVLFMASDLSPDGRILLEFARPNQHRPDSYREALACAGEFKAFMEARTGRSYSILRPRLARQGGTAFL